MTEPSRAVFLSYASQDAEAAQRICDALRAAGVEVWLDKSDLRGGDAWDRSIRQQIHDCALFVPIISQHTHERLEGYFRREWKLAVDRTHDMAEIKAFLVPVVVDSTTEQDPAIPEKFRELQWTRLPGGETPPAFVERVRRLLAPAESHVPTPGHAPTGPVSAAIRPAKGLASASWAKRVLPLAAAVVVLGVVAYLAIDKPWMSKPPAASPNPASAAPTAFAPPPHSIAVLPFVNMSGDKEQEYFSDGLTEELLNSLAEINELQVAARTSAFAFKGTNTDIGAIARKLNVGAVLEGSVRRSGNTVRITAQLINAVTGFHLWSHTYDRDLRDVLKLQAEIAAEVAAALKVTLLENVTSRIELGGTHNPAALDAYLRTRKLSISAKSAEVAETIIAGYTEAIRLDPTYALAIASRSGAFTANASEWANGAAIRENFDKAEADARKAIELAPGLAESHTAMAGFLASGALDFARASDEYKRAMELAPGSARIQASYGDFAARMGQFNAATAAARRAVALDPLNPNSYIVLGGALRSTRDFGQAVAALDEVLSLSPDRVDAYASRGLTQYALGDFQSARSSCEMKPDYWQSQVCLAITYDKLGRHADAENVLAKLHAAQGDDVAYQYAEIYAQWGDRSTALKWLDTAMRLRDPGLSSLKTDALMDPLRKEPRFQAIERELKFPD